MNPKQAQCLLTYLGYDTGGVDGIWGEKSRQAAMAFRRSCDLAADDGVLGEAGEKRLLEAVASGAAPAVSGEDWWKNIRYWSREEFKCRCGEYHAPYCDGYPVEPDRKLVELAEDVRSHFGRPGHRSSGIRCKRHNADSGGVSNSRHLLGKALDFRIEGQPSARVLAYVQTLPGVRYAYAIDGDYVHMDVE